MSELKRNLGFFQVTFYGIGTILGAGIYALIGKIVGVAGFLSPLSFVVSAFIAALTAYTYSELVKLFPQSAGEAEYVYQGFNSLVLSNLVGWMVALAGCVSSATLLNGFAGYFQVFAEIPKPLVILAIGVFCLALAIKGIKESVSIVTIFTIIEMGGLLIICIWGLPKVWEQKFLMEPISQAMSGSFFSPLITGAFLAFYAFIGFEDMVNLAEETKEPRKNLPRAIAVAMVVSTTLYFLVSLVSLSLLGVEELKNSDAPFAIIFQKMGGNPKIMSLIGLFAIFNGILAQIIMSSRILYGTRHTISKLQWLKDVHPKTQTPVKATIFVGIIVLALGLIFPIEKLASGTSFILLMVFTMTNLAFLFYQKKVDFPQKRKLILPIIATLVNLSFLLFSFL